jgi:amino acid permease
MTNKSVNLMRMVLGVAIVLLFALTAFLYFRTGRFDFTSFVGALMCTAILIITGGKRSARS